MISKAIAFDPAIIALSARAIVAFTFSGSERSTTRPHRSKSAQRPSRRA
jgi:hypothetical protein